jgi:hypothetical protein
MDIEKTFCYHKPNDNQITRYFCIRSMAKEFAELIVDACPDSREKSTALTKLQETVMWANASIAITEADNVSQNF